MDIYKTLTDSELINLSLKNSEAFGIIVERYNEKLSKYIKRRSHASKQDVEDILQNVFIKIYKNMNDYDENLNFSSWIYRITYNELIDWYRKDKTRSTLSLDDTDIGILEKISEETYEEILKKIDKQKEKELIEKSLEKIKPNYKEIIILKYFEDRSYEEISDILKIPIGTVATWVSRAKNELKKIIEKEK